MEEIFDLDHQYKLYLERVGLKEEKMHPAQKMETKRAFYGACGQMLVLLRDEVGKYDDHKAVAIMENLFNQVANFWMQQN